MNLDFEQKEEINYSIIIPHKNSTVLLERCLISIPCRKDVQVIVVDDNSENWEELNTVVDGFLQVELISTQGGGAGHARNEALKYIRGKWVLFADADDFFHQGFLSELDKYLTSQYDIVFFDVNSCFSDDLNPCEPRIYEISKGIKNRDVEYLKWKVHVVWGKLFNAGLIRNNHLLFDEVMASNDVMFACMASYHARKIEIDSFVLYCSTVNLNSLCYKMTRNNLDTRIDVALRYNKFVHSVGKGKYQINVFSILFFYKQLGYGLFFKMFIYYMKKSTLKMVVKDIKLTFCGGGRLLLGKNKLRKLYNAK